MTEENSSAPRADGDPPRKRPYVPPKLEKLGTIRELTQGAGKKKFFDGHHPPGQNKSLF